MSTAHHAFPGEESLVQHHAGLVRRHAYQLSRQLPPSLQMDDLIQAGNVGLLEAARKYDETQGVSFEAYASIRIRGAMVDELRRSTWTPRSLQRKARQVSETIKILEQRVGGEVRAQDIADALNIELNEYVRLQQDLSNARIASLDQEEGNLHDWSVAEAIEPEPYEAFASECFFVALGEAVEELPARERLVLKSYYDDDLKLREIGEALGVSESRVCQIHGQALQRLRKKMACWTQVSN